MKAVLMDDGKLILDAETSAEAYALRHWLSDRRMGKNSIEVRYKHAGSEDSFAALKKIMREETENYRAWLKHKQEQEAA